MSKPLFAKVKNVINGDTLLLVPPKSTQLPPPERIFTLAYVSTSDSFTLKETLRKLLVGKEVRFRVFYKIHTGKEFGDINTQSIGSLISYLVENGLAKVRENADEDDDFVQQLLTLEDKARTNALAIWKKDPFPEIITTELTDDIITKSQTSPITTIVERVISGDRVLGRIIINKNTHVITNITLAAVKAFRTDDTSLTSLQKKASIEAKCFIEDKLLSTVASIKVKILGKTQNGIPIGYIYHESGNDIQEKLLERGLAEIADWQSPLIGSEQMSVLRKAEQSAKVLGKGVYLNSKISSGQHTMSKPTTLTTGVTLNGVQISKVISSDTINIRLQSGEEYTVQLASIRAPKPSDTSVTSDIQQQQALINTGREFVRQKVIGKIGSVYVIGVRNLEMADGKSSKRFLVDFDVNRKGDLAQLIVSSGFATVIKHNKASLNERSLNWDKLVEIEDQEKNRGTKGVFYSGKDIGKVITTTRVVDASENANRAKAFLNGFKQKDRVSGYHVEHIFSVNRLRLFNPKEGSKLTLVLGGLSNDKGSKFADEGLNFLNRKILQRNVEFDVYDTDKIGAFIGNLYTDASRDPFQLTLVGLGYARLHAGAVSFNPLGQVLINAEDKAKNDKKGLWSQEEDRLKEVSEKIHSLEFEQSKTLFFDAEVTDINSEGVIFFRKLDKETQQLYASFKAQFSDFNSKPVSASNNSKDAPFNLSKIPKKNEYVIAKFSENGKYYRAKVVGFNKESSLINVQHLDFGNVDSVPLSSLRALPDQFSLSRFPNFAHSATLRNIRLPPQSFSDSLADSLDALDELTFDRKLVLSAKLQKGVTTSAEYSVLVYDSEKSLKDETYTVNLKLVSDGNALVDSKRVDDSDKDYVDSLLAVEKAAKSQHLGCWKFGDISFDEEPNQL